jgi:hypothetical protein
MSTRKTAASPQFKMSQLPLGTIKHQIMMLTIWKVVIQGILGYRLKIIEEKETDEYRD